jgi:hypothetical protein
MAGTQSSAVESSTERIYDDEEVRLGNSEFRPQWRAGGHLLVALIP